MTNTKHCPKCNKDLPIESFATGSGYCRTCKAAYMKELKMRKNAPALPQSAQAKADDRVIPKAAKQINDSKLKAGIKPPGLEKNRTISPISSGPAQEVQYFTGTCSGCGKPVYSMKKFLPTHCPECTVKSYERAQKSLKRAVINGEIVIGKEYGKTEE